MPCLKVQGPNYIRLIAEGPDRNVRGVRPGEVILGAVMNCGPNAISYDLDSLITTEGLMIGNIIKAVTNKLGIKQCLSCKGRQQRFNQKGIEFQRKIKDLF